jgi:hypothetical protein
VPTKPIHRLLLTLLLVTLLLGLAVVFFSFVLRVDEEHAMDDEASLTRRPGTRQSEEQRARPRGRLDGVERELLERQQRWVKKRAAAKTAAKESDMETPDTEQRGESLLTERMEARFQEESVDGAWAPVVERALSRAMDAEAFGTSRLLNVTCRKTLCRMSITHDDVPSQEQFLERFPFNSPSGLTSGTWKKETDEDGQPRTYLYLERKQREASQTEK